ncbi:glutathione S-transferase family protein [filamentous cyanobacterium LEGE 11480]|uniref:Glutathione S-transferase family protein n=2 Tax=Romeriopsis TaxID=2992131 RepID=A0A928Z650_9CYAN|nr:glutathione S-transferase family protein [Romeriopsis navalis LEGE 11480]
MLELHQFEASHYAEKVRLILDYKGLAYTKVEVVPGIGQLELFQKTGQRQVPVLKDEDIYIADSTAIAEYLDRKYPEKPVIPTDPKQKALCMIMEQWADDVLGLDARKGLIACLSQNPNFRTAFLPAITPPPVKSLLSGLPVNLLGNLGAPVGLGADSVRETIKHDLRYLSAILADQAYLLGDQPTLADFAVAGLTMYIKVPMGSYLNLPEGIKGEGVPGVSDSPEFDAFWAWRDKLYADFRDGTATTAVSNSDSQRPTSISID